MDDFSDLLEHRVPVKVAAEYLSELLDLTEMPLALQHAVRLKLAVSPAWVAQRTRQAAEGASGGRIAEVAGKTMKNVLGAVKRKGPNATKHVENRMAMHTAMRNAAADAAVHPSVRPGSSGVSLRKAASHRLTLAEKLAVAADMVRAEMRGDPSPEAVILQEQQGQLLQAQAENQALRAELEETAGAAEQHAESAEQASQQAELLQQQAQQTQMENEQTQMAAQQAQMESEQALTDAQMQLQQSQTEAQVHAQEAAAAADGKMRLAIRIQQMRQQLADFVAQDPVAEEGEQADPIMTSTQQGMGDSSMDPAAGGDPAADPAAAAGGDPTAQVPAEAAPAKPKAKPKSDSKSKDKGDSKPAKTEIKIGSVLRHAKLAAAVGIYKATAKEKTASRVPKEKGFKRYVELMSGSRLKALKSHEGGLGHAVDLADEAVDSKATRALTGLGAGLAGSGAAVGATGYALGKRKARREHAEQHKHATEEQVRSDARRASGRAGVLPGGALGAAAAHGLGKGVRGKAVGAALGAVLGRQQGRAGFDKRELANDFHMERALTKSRRDRAEKALEKSASLELSDDEFNRIFGL